MKLAMIALAGLAALTGCSTTGTGTGTGTGTDAPPEAYEARLCDAAAVQSYVGKTASTATGAAILAESGSRTLRWGPPNAAWTMDYRVDRVNVRYDGQMTIIGITCG